MNENELTEQAQFEELIQGLIDNDFGCCNDFLLPSTIIGLNANLQLLSDFDKLQVSGIGNRLDFQKNASIRGDKINWIADQSTNPYELDYLKKIQRFVRYLNQTCFTAITSFESHYAAYGVNSFYKRHLDQFKNEKGRKYSIVLYLNENWTDEDGGFLSLYPKLKDQINISPLGGRLVLFKSDEMEHEVHPSLTRERRSIAAWLKG